MITAIGYAVATAYSTNLHYIQSLLGHKSSKTTKIYTHITSHGLEGIVSPLDNL